MTKPVDAARYRIDVEVGGESWLIQHPGAGSYRAPSPFRNRDLTARVDRLRDWAGRPVPFGRADPLAVEAYAHGLARTTGETLDAIVLQGSTLAELRSGMKDGPIELRIRIGPVSGTAEPEADRALALPWELLAMDESGRFPAEAGWLTVIREAKQVGSPLPSEPSGSLKLAISLAAPEGFAGFDLEKESFRLGAALAFLGHRAHFTNLGTVDDLVALLEDVAADIIHFRGHSSPDGILFEDEHGFATTLSAGELRRRLAAVLLNPGRQARRFPQLFCLAAPLKLGRGEDPSMAAALHRSGFSRVLGVFGADEAEIRSRFEASFYGRIAEGSPPRQAWIKARAGLSEPVGTGRNRRSFPMSWLWTAWYERGTDKPLVVANLTAPSKTRSNTAISLRGLPVLRYGLIGRRDLLHEIRRKVELEGRRWIVIQGLGGLGKTALATQLIARVFAIESRDRLALVCRDLGSSAVSDLRTQAEEHGRIYRLPDWEERVHELRRVVPGPIAGLKCTLRSIRSDFSGLVVLIDNLESLQKEPESGDPGGFGRWPPAFKDLLEEMAGFAEEEGCLTLVTTRYAWEGLDPRSHVGLSVMNRADSLRLIDTFEALSSLSFEDRKRLAEQVDGHPRTVELLEGLLAQHRDRLPSKAGSEDEAKGIWAEMIVPLIREKDQLISSDLLLEKLWSGLSKQGRRHLRVLRVLRRPARSTLIDQLGPARDELIRLGWLTRYREQVIDDAGDWWVDLWGLHSTTRDFLLDQPSEGNVEHDHRMASEAFEEESERLPGLEIDTTEAVYHACKCGDGDRVWPLAKSHVLSLRDEGRYHDMVEVLEFCESGGTTGDELAQVLVLNAQAQSFLGAEPERLETLLNKALEHAVTAESRNSILQEKADLAADLGRFKEAETLLQEVLREDEAAFGLDHPSYSSALFAFATVLEKQGRYEESENRLRESQSRLERRLGPANAQASSIHHALAGSLELQGKYAEAEREIRLALSLERGDHPDRAASLNSLAQILGHQGRHEEAEEALREALAVLDESFSEAHPDRILLMNTLAGSLLRQGRFADAESLLRHAGVAFPASVLRSAGYGTALQILAIALDEQGKHREALELLRKALELQEGIFGSDHPELIPTLQTLGVLWQHVSRTEEAACNLEKAVQLSERWLGSQHPSTAMVLQTWANLMLEKGEANEAEKILRKVLAIEEEAHGAGSPQTSAALHTLAQTLVAREELDEAERLIRRAVRTDEANLGRGHPSSIDSLFELALIVSERGSTGDALSILRDALSREVKARGTGSLRFVVGRTNEARFLVELGELEEAEGLLLSLRDQLEASDTLGPEARAQMLATLAEVRFLLGRSDALSVAGEALEYLETSFPAEHPVTAQLKPDLLYFLDQDDEEDSEPPSQEEVRRLETLVKRLQKEGDDSEIRDALEDLSIAMQSSKRYREAARLMEEVVEIDQRIDHPELVWDRRLVMDLKRLADEVEGGVEDA